GRRQAARPGPGPRWGARRREPVRFRSARGPRPCGGTREPGSRSWSHRNVAVQGKQAQPRLQYRGLASPARVEDIRIPHERRRGPHEAARPRPFGTRTPLDAPEGQRIGLQPSVSPAALQVNVAAKQSSPTRIVVVPSGTAEPAALKPEADAVIR